MSGYDPPGLAQVAAHESKTCHKARSDHPHPHHGAHDHHSKMKKKRNSGAKALDQLVNALARSTLKDDDSKHENGKKLTKNQRKKQENRVAHKKARVSKPASLGGPGSRGQNGKGTTRETRSMHRMLPLGFDNLLLVKASNHGSWFMNNDQIRVWIKSVFTPHIENWYHEYVSTPENRLRLKSAQDNPYVFGKAVVEEAMDQHSSSGPLGSLQGETDACPSAFHLEKKENHCLTFFQHSAMTACLVVRDGERDGGLALCPKKRTHHYAAAMLLATVIMDLKNDLGYFERLLLGVEGRDAPVSGDKQALMPLRASEEREQSLESQTSFTEESRVLRMSSELFGTISKALLRLQHNSDCKMSFHRPDALGDGYLVTLAGTSDHVRNVEQAIQFLMESSTVSAEMGLMGLSIQASRLSIG